MPITVNQPADKPANVKVIKFDQGDDIHIRRAAKYCHDLSKQLRDVGITFVRNSPVIQNPTLMRKHKFSKKSKAMDLMIALSGNSLKDKQLIDDVLSFFIMRDDYVVIDHGNVDKYSYHFVIDHTKPTQDEKEMKEDLIDSQPE